MPFAPHHRSESIVPENTVAARWYVLMLLTVVYAFNIADRFMMSTLIEPIKADLHLSDSSIGLLTGVALALFYVAAGLPLALVADRGNRRNLLVFALLGWSLATAACGATRSFGELLLARVLVGVGEAGGTPPSHSLISDYFSPSRRALAFSIYAIGASLGSMLGATSGIFSEMWGWRTAFWVLGLPGAALALLILVTVREPLRGRLESEVPVADRAGFGKTLTYIRRHSALTHCLIGGSVFTLWSWGLMWWTPSYLIRSHHMRLGEAGSTLALIHGLGGTLALVGTTLCMPIIERRGPRAVPNFTAIVIAVATVPSVIAFTTQSASMAIAMLWIFIPLSYCTFGPIFSLLQNLVPPDMRSQAVAVLLFFSNIANLVIAPQLVGLVSDALAPHFGVESLRMALLPLTLCGFWAAWELRVTSARLPISWASH